MILEPRLFNDLIGASEQQLRHSKIEVPRGCGVNHEIELCGLLNRKISRLCAARQSDQLGRNELPENLDDPRSISNWVGANGSQGPAALDKSG